MHYDNIFLEDKSIAYNYTSKKKVVKNSTLPPRDVKKHGKAIQDKLEAAWQQVSKEDAKRAAVSLPCREGTYLEFVSAPNFDLNTKSMENVKQGIRLLNIKNEETDEGNVNKATVFVPKGKEKYFLDKTKQYITDLTDKGKPRNMSLIASIEDIRLAILESFWSGDKQWMPDEVPVWCEVWLNQDTNEVETKFRSVAAKLNISTKKEKLSFPERRIVFILANKNMLESLIEETELIAEIRRATEVISFFTEMDNKDQTEWVEDLSKRINIQHNTNTYISILDTGINNGHILLKDLLKDENCYSYEETWGKYDHNGHGTKMAGIGLFGNIEQVLASSAQVDITHQLESYKILPPNGENDPQLYGAITMDAISNLVIDNPERKRVLCMAVSAPKYETGDGTPSSWSAAVDELTSGYLDNMKKLFIIAAGNINDTEEYSNYPNSNLLFSVQNPGQSWNAITVGAYTEKYKIDTDQWGEKQVLAQPGSLSPYSTTSLIWNSKWPIKPEIVLEGGNLIKDDYGCFQCEDLSVLTTNYKPHESQLTTFWATSAATAEAAYIAAKLQDRYPNAWPETIRGLMIHSATWKEQMKKEFLDGDAKTNYRKLLRTFGYGVADLKKAIDCTKNRVNMIIQSELQPFDKKEGGGYRTKDMHIHEIPWPKKVLEELFDTEVEMKVTLSYFIEPGPGEVGWKDRYRYPSCGLRFETNGSLTEEEFRWKISRMSEDENYSETQTRGISPKWLLGANNRNVGSIHSDVWKGTAAELAISNLIAIYPTVGWWRERAHLGKWDSKIRYSLIVSITTPKVNTDLYTPIINKITSTTQTRMENIVEI